MSGFSKKDVQHLAGLSGLILSDEEAVSLGADMERIITYINLLDELDVTGVEPTYQVTGLQNVWREDEVRPGVSREALLDLAPEQQDNQVKVPQVL